MNRDGCSLSFPKKELIGITQNMQGTGSNQTQQGNCLVNLQLRCGAPWHSTGVPKMCLGSRSDHYIHQKEKHTQVSQIQRHHFDSGISTVHRSLEAGKVFLFFTACHACRGLKPSIKACCWPPQPTGIPGPTVLADKLGSLVFSFYVTWLPASKLQFLPLPSEGIDVRSTLMAIFFSS